MDDDKHRPMVLSPIVFEIRDLLYTAPFNSICTPCGEVMVRLIASLGPRKRALALRARIEAAENVEENKDDVN